MPLWHRLAIVGVVLLVTAVVARLIDRSIAKRDLAPGQATRYRVLRRTVMSTIVFLGILSALLVIPAVRAVAGGLLASSAILGLVIGFAAQTTLSNFVSGVLIAFAQPLRLGDRVSIDGTEGTVEEIGLTYTFIRTLEDRRLVIPNAKLASDTILNSTIRSREQLAQITVQVPLQTDLQQLVDTLRREAGDERAEVLVTSLEGDATVTVRTWAPDPDAARRLESDLRL
ncbi:MAG: mechanosensitive ion channel family protein, partial [Actinomycetota bacterium]|nr:mechanosensitive ion channel family protein [Actinomycetota bacterium]